MLGGYTSVDRSMVAPPKHCGDSCLRRRRCEHTHRAGCSEFRTFDPLEQGRPWLAYLFKPCAWSATDPTIEIASPRVTVGAGMVTVITLGWILNRLQGQSRLSGMMLGNNTLAVFHERMALQDPFVTTLLSMDLASQQLVAHPSLKIGASGRGFWRRSAIGVCISPQNIMRPRPTLGSAWFMRVSSGAVQ